jgi:hypothetical protein
LQDLEVENCAYTVGNGLHKFFFLLQEGRVRAGFRVFGLAAWPSVLPPGVVLFWDWLLVQSSSPADVSPVLVGRFHFAVGHSLGCVVFRRRASLVTCSASSRALSSSFASL